MVNRPPGYYKDEYGRDYYWDGQHRSYIPQNSYQQFKRDYNEFSYQWTRAMLWLLGIFFGIPLGLILIVAMLDGFATAISENSGGTLPSLTW
jgi:hypothetical protein